MKMKSCQKCKMEKPITEFHKNKNNKDGLSYRCKLCRNKDTKKYYQKHKDKIDEYHRIRKEKIKKWFFHYKSFLKCETCGENHIACLTFHHIKAEEKEDIVSAMVNRAYSIKTIMKEIKKCKVLCFNCHMKLHWREK